MSLDQWCLQAKLIQLSTKEKVQTLIQIVNRSLRIGRANSFQNQTLHHLQPTKAWTITRPMKMGVTLTSLRFWSTQRMLHRSQFCPVIITQHRTSLVKFNGKRHRNRFDSLAHHESKSTLTKMRVQSSFLLCVTQSWVALLSQKLAMCQQIKPKCLETLWIKTWHA